MNWLAHIFVSRNCIDYQLGNLLADPLKGKLWDGASKNVHDGFRMHRGIDAFTDSNQHVHQSKSRLGEKGYLKGVVVDMAYDYLLLKNWHKYSSVDANAFINHFHYKADSILDNYPPEAQDFVQRLKRNKVFKRYENMDGLEEAFIQLDKRLPEKILSRETTSSYMPLLRSAITEMEQDFVRFFPELLSYFIACEDPDLDDHWLL
jgi:acyl carrier protein phosphodiesterase